MRQFKIQTGNVITRAPSASRRVITVAIGVLGVLAADILRPIFEFKMRSWILLNTLALLGLANLGNSVTPNSSNRRSVDQPRQDALIPIVENGHIYFHHIQYWSLKSRCLPKSDRVLVYQDAITFVLDLANAHEIITNLFKTCDNNDLRAAVNSLPEELAQRYRAVMGEPSFSNLPLDVQRRIAHRMDLKTLSDLSIASKDTHQLVTEKAFTLDHIQDWPRDKVAKMLNNVVKRGNVPAIKTILERGGLSSSDIDKALEIAEKHWKHYSVEQLMKNPRQKPSSTAIEKVFLDASREGNFFVIDRLRQNHRFPQNAINQGFKNAAENGHLEVVDRLLDRKLLTPDQEAINSGFVSASTNGHVAVVSRILNNGQLSATQDAIHSGFLKAAMKGRLNVVNFIFSHYLFQQQQSLINDAFVKAAKQGHHLVVDRLLMNQGLKPDQDAINNGFKKAAEADSAHLKVVDRILTNEELKPDQEAINEGFKCATLRRNIEIVDRILTNEVKPDQEAINKGFKRAAVRRDIVICDRLVANQGLKPNRDVVKDAFSDPKTAMLFPKSYVDRTLKTAESL